MSHCRRPVPALLLIAGALCAAEAPIEAPRGGPTILDGGGGGGLAPLSEFAPGRTAVGAGRQVVVQGLLDFDVLQTDNYTDSSGDASDNRGYGLMRAELGLRLKLDERATAVVGFGYRADLGDYGKTNQRPGKPTPGDNQSQIDSDQSQLVLKDAYVHLKEFLGFEEMGVIAGRVPVTWNLVSDRGAFLWDSRADDPVIGSWDGARASYSGFDALLISPWVYRLPDASTLAGLTLDWKPVTAGGDKVFLTGTYAEHGQPVVGGQNKGEKLKTFSAGFDWRLGETGLWIEGASQRGDGNGQSYAGMGGEAGIDWQFSQYGKGRLQIIGTWMTGDDPSTPDKFEGFVNDWETIGDTLIVEHEKYGELSRLVVGNLQAMKVRWGIGFDERDRVRIDLTGAHYRLDQPLTAGGSTDFGTELDVILRWQYTYNAQIRLFGAVFKPGEGLAEAQEAAGAAATPPVVVVAGDDLIWLMGANLNVTF